MSETIMIAIFSALLAFICGWCGWLTHNISDLWKDQSLTESKLVDRINQGQSDVLDRLNQINYELSNRLSKIEMAFKILGKNAAELLHSPHTPIIDLLLEKLSAETITQSELRQLIDMSSSVEKDLTEPKEKRAFAGAVKALCHLALHEPVGQVMKHEDNTILINKTIE